MEHAVLDDVGVDSLGLADADDLVDRGLHCAYEPQDSVAPARLGVPVEIAGELGRKPAAVAPGCSVPGELLLQHDDPQIGLLLREVVRGPQPGEPCADDADVGSAVARELLTALGYADLVVPERHCAVRDAAGVLAPVRTGAHPGTSPFDREVAATRRGSVARESGSRRRSRPLRSRSPPPRPCASTRSRRGCVR